jgi:hypothetical protein
MSSNKNTLIPLDYNGLVCEFNEDGWFNATSAAHHFERQPNDWLVMHETAEYVCTLHECLSDKSCLRQQFNEIKELYDGKNNPAAQKAKFLRLIKETGLVKTKTGGLENGGGTWFHPKLAVPFARWLDVRFAIWCDIQIDRLIRGQHPHFDWKRQRLTGKIARREVTDAQQRFIEYAKANGSQNADKYWANFVRMTNAELGLPQIKDVRDQLDVRQLTNLGTAEYIEASVIDEGVLAGMDYHDIFQMAKHRVKDLARLLDRQMEVR